MSRYSAIKRLGKRAKQDYSGPVQLGGVGGVKTESKYGIYQVRLPLCSGSDAILSGVCLEKITESFPTYPLQGKVMQDIISSYTNSGGNSCDLPKVPVSVGGNIDFMIGIKYLRHHPRLIYQLPSGLSIYESMFRNSDGTRGVIGGPHEVFTKIEEQFRSNISSTLNSKSYISQQLELYRKGYYIDTDFDFINFKSSKNPDIYFDVSQDQNTCMLTNKKIIKDTSKTDSLVIRSEKVFNLVENAASEITYRCVNCRNCKQCKDDEKTEIISIKEEIEQDLINKSVSVDIINRICTAKLPVIHNPSHKLAPNINKALAIYKQQIKELEKNPKDKQDVIASEAKLHTLGHVCYSKDLPRELQKILQEHPIQNYIPWRAVWKESSLSTPCRVVFDASSNTGSGYNLNDILVKGQLPRNSWFATRQQHSGKI